MQASLQFHLLKPFYLTAAFLLLITSCKEKEDTSEVTTQNQTEEVQQTPLQASVNRGREIYSELCVTCHLPSGKGVPGAFPPLHPSDWLTEKRTESIHAVKYGLKGEITVNGETYDSVMLPLGLDDQEVADVMNYTIQTWNEGKIVTVEEVAAVKE
ncbi:c-type cytochrome [Nonlabens xiamenensis]|uniref:c-type cytochrome n=1 Tax=Nonlabens xiamenensis TaxID=2341043 RepID=UPI000F6125AC|nr:cytochrome c [Nonlabens xiamenensis]